MSTDDPYKKLAALVLDIPVDQVTDVQRTRTKRAVLEFVYTVNDSDVYGVLLNREIDAVKREARTGRFVTEYPIFKSVQRPVKWVEDPDVW